MTNEEAGAMIEKWSAWCKEHEGYDLLSAYHAEHNLYDGVAIVVMNGHHIVAIYTNADYFDTVRSYCEDMEEATR